VSALVTSNSVTNALVTLVNSGVLTLQEAVEKAYQAGHKDGMVEVTRMGERDERNER
jgi:hypothetical protein